MLGGIYQAYLKAGLHTIEITMNTAGATRDDSQTKERISGSQYRAGTVCNMEDTIGRSGRAQFIVTPILDESGSGRYQDC